MADLLYGYIDLQIQVHVWSVLVDAVKYFCFTSQHEVSKLLKFCYVSTFSIKGGLAGNLNLCDKKINVKVFQYSCHLYYTLNPDIKHG